MTPAKAWQGTCPVCGKRRLLYHVTYVMFEQDLGWKMCRPCAHANDVWETKDTPDTGAAAPEEDSP